MFVPRQAFQPSLTKTLALCKNSYITGVKSFITLAPVDVPFVFVREHINRFQNTFFNDCTIIIDMCQQTLDEARKAWKGKTL